MTLWTLRTTVTDSLPAVLVSASAAAVAGETPQAATPPVRDLGELPRTEVLDDRIATTVRVGARSATGLAAHGQHLWPSLIIHLAHL
jgi:hypothetical protein